MKNYQFIVIVLFLTAIFINSCGGPNHEIIAVALFAIGIVIGSIKFTAEHLKVR